MLHRSLDKVGFLWALHAVCVLHRKPFSADLAEQQLAAPYTTESLLRAVQGYGFETTLRRMKSEKLHKESFPLIAWFGAQPASSPIEQESKQDAGEGAVRRRRKMPDHHKRGLY